jgi:hypothetical protein
MDHFPEWYKWVAFAGAVACAGSLIAVLVMKLRGIPALGITWSLKPA